MSRPTMLVSLLSVLIVSACATAPDGEPAPPAVVVTWSLGLDTDIAMPTRQILGPNPSGLPTMSTAAWGASGHMRIVTWASASCPLLPDTVTARGQTIYVSTVRVNPSQTICSQESVPATSIVKTPLNVNRLHQTVVDIDGIKTNVSPSST